MYLPFAARIILMPLALLTVQAAGDKEAEALDRTANQMRQALDEMMKDRDFLSGAEYLAPLKKRIQAENKKDPILQAAMSSSNPGGTFIGRWGYDANAKTFSYIAKSDKRDELFMIRGNFLERQVGKWSAKIAEASVTKLSNVFGSREVDKIKERMTLDQVTKTLGVAPGAYFAGEVAFTYRGGGRHSSNFTGTSSKFIKSESRFFSAVKGDKKDYFSRAWISNDLAVIVAFDPDGLVRWIDTDRVTCPYEYWDDIWRDLFGPKPESREKK